MLTFEDAELQNPVGLRLGFSGWVSEKNHQLHRWQLPQKTPLHISSNRRAMSFPFRVTANPP